MAIENDKKLDNTEQKGNSESNNRREFLKNAGLLGAGLFAGSISQFFIKRVNKGENTNTIKLKVNKDSGLKTGL